MVFGAGLEMGKRILRKGTDWALDLISGIGNRGMVDGLSLGSNTIGGSTVLKDRPQRLNEIDFSAS